MEAIKICGFCGLEYCESLNHPRACRYHSEFYFPYDLDQDGHCFKGWQCCGSEDPTAPGCTLSCHRDDVEKRFYPNSLRYYYETIDPLKKMMDQQRQNQLVHLKTMISNDMEFQKLWASITTFENHRLCELEGLIGSPKIERPCSNGTSGFIYHFLTLYYEFQGVFFRATTKDYPYWKRIPRHNQILCRFNWFADELELKLDNQSLMTDLSS